MKNKLSVFLEHIYDASKQTGKTVEKELLFAKDCGIDYLECDLWRLENKRETKALFDSCGIGVSSVYRFFDLANDDRNTSEKKYRELLETTAYFGGKKVLCVPGFFTPQSNKEEEMKIIAERISEMCLAAKEYGITVTMEDFDDEKSPCSTASGLEYFMHNAEGLRFCFDTGNFRYSLEDAAEAYEKLHSFVSHIHCKDRIYDSRNADRDNTNGKADLSGAVMYPCPIGSGVIGIGGLVERACADGYDDIVAIEHFGAVDQEQYMKISAEFLRSV